MGTKSEKDAPSTCGHTGTAVTTLPLQSHPSPGPHKLEFMHSPPLDPSRTVLPQTHALLILLTRRAYRTSHQVHWHVAAWLGFKQTVQRKPSLPAQQLPPDSP
jgi:hypothetical protein